MVLVTILLKVVSSIHYVYCAWTRRTSPVPATWILLLTTMALSLWMYWHSENKSWTANIGLMAAFGSTVCIFVGVIASHIRHKTLVVTFNRVQKGCLMAGALIVLFWTFTRQPLISYVLVQCIALVGYFATVQKLRSVTSSTEPLFLWVCVLLSGLSALYPAWVKSDVFACIYLGRAIPSTVLMVLLIAKIKTNSAPLSDTASS